MKWREIARLAVEAVRVEVDRWLHPEPAGAPAPEAAPVADAPRHVYTACIACCGPLAGGHDKLCQPCVDARIRWAKERESPRPARRRKVAS